jgi:ubiquinone/menaquinone biosynthesis C-methylase UbiE
MTHELSWKLYLLEHYRVDFPRGAQVLDVGCGPGNQLYQLGVDGCVAVGIDISLKALQICRGRGMNVIHAAAEFMPIKDAQFDGLLCKVVLPYTKEELTIPEFSRLLKPGGKAYIEGHGIGYYLRYLLLDSSWKRRVYAIRTIINTWLWILTGARLPWFLGDTTYQSHNRLKRHYEQCELQFIKDTPSRHFIGFPVFLYHVLQKPLRSDG